MMLRVPGEASAEFTAGCCREEDPEALGVDGVAGEERQATRELLAPDWRTKERASGRNSSPERCGGRSVELQIQVTEEMLGAGTGGKRERSLRGSERCTPMALTVAGTSASRRPKAAELRASGSSSTVDERMGNGQESVEERAGRLLSQKWQWQRHRGRHAQQEAVEHYFGDQRAGGKG
jgi:hypothetical protein